VNIRILLAGNGPTLHFVPALITNRLLTHADLRLGRTSIMDVMDHPVFDGVDWDLLPSRKRQIRNVFDVVKTYDSACSFCTH
jgi:hypothetical protein